MDSRSPDAFNIFVNLFSIIIIVLLLLSSIYINDFYIESIKNYELSSFNILIAPRDLSSYQHTFVTHLEFPAATNYFV